MFAQSIELVNFRNYKKQCLDFGENLNVICGNNAQGKTNILEAIFLCSAGKSHRTSKDSDMVKIGASSFFVKLLSQKQKTQNSIEIFYRLGEGKSIRVNGKNLNRIGQLMGNLYCVIFSPEDLSLVKEGPSQRRRFIDVFLSQVKPAYFYDVQQYLKILKQKNALLKQFEKREKLFDTIDVWNGKLAETGARVMANRAVFTEKIACEAAAKHLAISEGKEELTLKYKPSFDIKIKGDVSIKDIEREFITALNKVKDKEAAQKTALIGPQKDDIDIIIDGTNIRQYGSQGQQRTAALAMKMAEMEVLTSETRENPVLLLDDVMSELDSARRDLLLKNCFKAQTFITTSGNDFILTDFGKSTNVINIDKGNIY